MNNSEICLLLSMIKGYEDRGIFKDQDYLIMKMQGIREKLIDDSGISIDEINNSGWGELIPQTDGVRQSCSEK